MVSALFVLHALVGLLFVGHGSQKLFGVLGGYGLEGTAGVMESLGLRPGRLHATAAAVAELVGGLLLALGLLTPVGAALIIAVMTTATLTAHRGRGLWNSNGGFELPLVLAAVAFTLATIGAGDASLDHALGLDVNGLGWGLGALAAGVLGSLAAIGVGRSHGTRAGRGAQPLAS